MNNTHGVAVKWLMDNDIPSVSPGIGILLLNIHGEIERCKDSAPTEILAYQSALRLICEIAAPHQKAVIDRLEQLVNLARDR